MFKLRIWKKILNIFKILIKRFLNIKYREKKYLLEFRILCVKKNLNIDVYILFYKWIFKFFLSFLNSFLCE